MGVISLRAGCLVGLITACLAGCAAPIEDGAGGNSSTHAASTVASGGAGGVGGSLATTSVTSASSSKASTGSGGITAAQALGRACTDDSDCGPLTCVTADSGKFAGEGPQGGVCTKPCASDTPCTNIVGTAHCLAFGVAGYCDLGCDPGSATPASAKCRGRDDFACASYIDQNNNFLFGACSPTCTSDGGCGAGLYCDYGTGLCTATQPVGLGFGDTCDPQATNSECASGACICANAQCTTGFCTGLCPIGSPLLGCGGDGTGGCLLVTTDDFGDGDMGYCAQLCDCNGDCGQPLFDCNVLPAVDQQLLGHEGMCYPPYTQTISVCCSCQDKVCGTDGCGTSCGTCPLGDTCVNAGECCAACAGKACGPDGCGGTCGTCPPADTCNAQGQCECIPNCGSNVCGPDGCGGSCGMCQPGDTCAGGSCCTPDCAGKACGSNGCGGVCGTCAPNEFCNASSQCQCQPNCAGKNCGPDGCGGSCGSCMGSAVCNAGSCCTPNCAGKMCGSNSCGGSCGTCAPGATCTASNQCCQPSASCFNDSECCGKYCDIITDTCVTCLPNGGFSSGNPLKCCSHLDNGGNCVACEPATGSCATTFDCCAGLTCNSSHFCL